MSTGADCSFYEKAAGNWYYKIQSYPYGETEDYTLHGPFKNFRAAEIHLDGHYSNPGGYCISPLPGCKHKSRNCQGGCDYCGDTMGENS